jgi:hypothetical protein
LQIIDCTAEDGTYLRFEFLNIKNFVLQNLRLPQNAELNIGDCRFKRLFEMIVLFHSQEYWFYKV